MYFDDHRHTAIVCTVHRRRAEYVYLDNGAIQHRVEPVVDFARRYPYTWPHYPVRRAARVYYESLLTRDPVVDRALRALLVS